LRCLAEITSLAVELMHKCAEQLLMPRKVDTKVDVILETQVLQKYEGFQQIECIIKKLNHFILLT